MILGNTTVGSIDDTQNNNAKTVNPIVIPRGCVVVAAYGYLNGNTGSQPFRVVLYTDSAGSPSALLGKSDDVTVNVNGYQWWFFSFSTPVALSASTVWVGYHGGTVTGTQPQMKENASGSFKYQNVTLDTFSDGASDPFGTISGTIGATSLTLYLVTEDGLLLGLGMGA